MDDSKRIFILKCIAILIVPFIFNYLFVSDVQSYTRIMMDELHNDGFIDVLFLGTSHTYRSYDVELIERLTGLNVFNGGTSAQQLEGSYYILKGANENNGIKTVWLDLTYIITPREKPGKTETYIITDYMWSFNDKYSYLYSTFGLEGIINGVWPFLHSCSVSPLTLMQHINGDYKNNSYKYVAYDNEAYYGQGFVYNFETVDQNYVFNEGEFINPDNMFSNYSMKYLNKIISYCDENNIELVFVNPPMPDGTLVSSTNYQMYIDKISSIARENNLRYLDFNLLKKEELTMNRNDYYDAIHLNGTGARKYSSYISNILNGKISDLFYLTYEEKLEKNPDNTLDNY